MKSAGSFIAGALAATVLAGCTSTGTQTKPADSQGFKRMSLGQPYESSAGGKYRISIYQFNLSGSGLLITGSQDLESLAEVESSKANFVEGTLEYLTKVFCPSKGFTSAKIDEERFATTLLRKTGAYEMAFQCLK